MLSYSIELNAETIYHPRTKEYFCEVLQSYVNGSNRSAVVMLYSVVVSDLVYKLQELKDRFDDDTAKDILNEIKRKQEENPKNSEWETFLIRGIIDRTNILETSDEINLEHLRNHRHLSAHPVLNQESLLVEPNNETVRSLIRSMLEGILTKNPILSRNVLKLLLKDMAENKSSFINDYQLKEYLDSKYLKNANKFILNVLFKDLWNITFNCSSEECAENRKINTNVLNILYHTDRTSNQNYFNDNKEIFKIKYEEDILLKITEFIGDNREIYDLLEGHDKIKLSEKMSSSVKLIIRSPFLHDDMESHFKNLSVKLTNQGETLVLDYKLDEEEMILLEKWAIKNEVINDYYMLLIELFVKSISFNSADRNYIYYIQSNLDKFNVHHFSCLYEGINTNSQCFSRSLARKHNTEIKVYSNRVFAHGVDYDEKYPNVDFFLVE